MLLIGPGNDINCVMCEDSQDFEAECARMVAQQISDRGIHDANLLSAMREVPRHRFVEGLYQKLAYSDAPLPIPAQQTISQPYIVAFMISELKLGPGDVVLEVGTGSGYAAAILSLLASRVITIERHSQLIDFAQERLTQLGYENVEVIQGDGTLGYQLYAPYDGIMVSAGGPRVPQSLQNQLAVGGRLVMPVGRNRRRQQLIRVTRISEGEFTQKSLGPVAFVPLIGREGWGSKRG